MKILFLHLSDIHSHDDITLENIKLSRIPNALRSFHEIDECVIICSGDLANTGKISEYTNFNRFLEKLKLDLKKEFEVKQIHILLVPGNHDLTFTGNDRECKDILGYMKQGTIGKEYVKELDLMRNFRDYAQTQNCFSESLISDTKIINFEKFNLQVNLLNTAPFSTKQNDNKELHYFPEEDLYSIVKQDNVNLAITVIHHSAEWFSWDSKKLLDSLISNHSEIVFQGHDHDVDTVNITNKMDDMTLVSKGGVYSGKLGHRSTFSALVFNSENYTINQKLFEWDPKQYIYKSENVIINKIITPKIKKLKVKKSFVKELLVDKQSLTDNLIDYFVFPTIKQRNETTIADKNKVVDEEVFFEQLTKIPAISIIGKNNAGKTAFLKYVYSKSLEMGLFPLFVGSENIKKNSNIGKIIKGLFEEQYSEDDMDFERYEQLRKGERIIIIDDFDYIDKQKNREILLDYLSSEMGCVIFSTNESFSVDLSEQAKKIIENETEIVEFVISDFYKIKRTELIKKICETDTRLCATDAEDISKIIDHLVHKKHELFNLSPDFIIQCVKYFIGLDKRERKSEAVFNIIFDTNIRNSIIKNAEKQDVQNFLISLEEIAFYMHSNKKDKVSPSEIEMIIKNYNLNYTLTISPKKFVDAVTKSKILNCCIDSLDYQFCSRNHLAYFIANKINKLIDKKGKDIEELNYIIKNICFGINDTILLFLSYFRNNTNFALSLCNNAESLLFNIEELDFDQPNISFIKGLNKSEVKLPTAKQKNEYKKLEDNTERKRRKKDSLEIKYRDLYNYDENDAEKFRFRISRAIKYIEIIAKSLNSQFSILEASEKNRIVECLYKLPNRILFAILKQAEEKYDEIINDLKELADTLELEKKPGEEELKKIVNDCSVLVCLSLYDSIAFCCATSTTLPVLDNYSLTNSNYSILNLMMQENSLSTEVFVEKACKLAQGSEDDFLYHLIRMVVRKHVITHDTLIYKQLDKLSTPISIQGKTRCLFDKTQLLMLTGVSFPESE